MTGGVSAERSNLRDWLRTPGVHVGALTILGLIIAVWVLSSTYWTFRSGASEMSMRRLVVVWGLGLVALALLARAAWKVKHRPTRDVDDVTHDV